MKKKEWDVARPIPLGGLRINELQRLVRCNERRSSR